MLSIFNLSLIAASLLWLNTGLASGGNGVGNGGNSVTCSDSQGKMTSAVLLDLYENEVTSNSEKDDPAGKSDPFELAKQNLNDLNHVHPRFSKVLRARIGSLKSEAEFKDGVSLTKIDDSFHIFEPAQSNCKVVQVAIRRSVVLDSEKRFVINKQIWDQFKTRSKIGLILHEVIYEYFSKLGEKDSRKARLYNYKLLSGQFKNITAAEYWNLIKKLKLPIYPD
jgi:hypothetical protein